MKRLFIFIIVLLVLFIAGFYVITKGKGTYKYSEGIGYSKTLKESKERGVFVKELNYKIVPDTIKLANKFTFFIERGFRYGKYSADETLPLKETDNYKYQVGREPISGEVFIGDYLLGTGVGNFNILKDTFKYDIVTKVPHYDSIYKVGELILYDDKK